MKLPALAATRIALAILLIDAAARAQDVFPARPIQIIVPATAGGPVDTAVRMIEPALAAALGKPVVLLNRPGASGTLGMQDVATAEPNGYTIGQGVNSIFTITRISGTTVPFTLDNFTLLGNYATDVSVLAVNAETPWQTLDDVILCARQSRQAQLRVRRRRHRVGAEHPGAGAPFQDGYDGGTVSGQCAAHHRDSRQARRHRHGALHHGRGDV
jgi:tripartite-type tricarboxylate transporter receptor subunit TctC